MVILELRELAEVLEKKVQSVQREFTGIADQLTILRRKWSEVEETERPQVVEQQNQLRERQQILAEEVNLWRDRLRAIETPQGENSIAAVLAQLEQCGIEDILAAVKRSRELMAMDPEEKAALFSRNKAIVSNTPAGRLIERARTSYDLRHGGSNGLQKAAIEFSNRPSNAMDDALLSELEAVFADPDPIVSEAAMRAVIQALKFRALRSAEIAVSKAATQRITQINNVLVIPTLIEILKTSRTAYAASDKGAVEESNTIERLMALITLVEKWRTPEVQEAIQMRTYDKEPQIANAATKALQAFPPPWGDKGSTK